MITLLLVEDNEGIRSNLSTIINKKFKDIKLVTVSTGKEAIKIIREKNIDLFFLDIELPDITGMEIAKEIRSIEQYEFSFIVFITAHTFLLKEALQKYNCYDFIEKPFNDSQIVDTLEKLIKGTRLQTTNIKKTIKIENGVYLYKIILEDIFYIEIQSRRLKVHTITGIIIAQNIPLLKVMKMINDVDCNFFMMTHRSYIVNLNKLSNIKQVSKRLWEITFKEYDHVALLSDKYKSELFDKI